MATVSSSPPLPLTLELPAHLLCNAAVVRQLIVAFWGHVLYTRGQIPLPLDSVLTGKIFAAASSSAASGQQTVTMSKATRGKITKFINRFQSIIAAIDAVLEGMAAPPASPSSPAWAEHGLAVTVMIGASATAPREACELRICPGGGPHAHTTPSNNTNTSSSTGAAAAGATAAGAGASVPQRSIDQAGRVLIRTLVGQWETSSRVPPLSSTFIALSPGPWDQATLPDRAAAEFNRRDGFRVKLRRRAPPVLQLTAAGAGATAGGAAAAEEDDDEDGEEEDDQEEDNVEEDIGEADAAGGESATWWVLRKGLRSLKGL
jgi:hypothetical protein